MAEDRDDVIRGAGAVVWRPGRTGPEVALVHRPRYDDWSYPKGKCRRGEHVLSAAVREVAEEAGVRVVLGRPLTASVYPAGGRSKRVSYWTARCAQALPLAVGEEVDEVAWLAAGQVRQRLTYQRDIALLDEMESGPVATVPFILLRHASAGRKADKPGATDLARPLDARGAVDSELLAGLLACYGPCRVISSPAERCVATVRPYAAEFGALVEAEPAFAAPAAEPAANGGEQPDRRMLRQAAARVRSLAAAGVPTVICAHRENLPVMIGAALASLGDGQPGPPRERPGQPGSLRKGGFLVLQTAAGLLVSSEWQDVAG